MNKYLYVHQFGEICRLSDPQHPPAPHPQPGGGFQLRAILPSAKASLASIALDPSNALEEVTKGGWWVLAPSDLRPGWKDTLTRPVPA